MDDNDDDHGDDDYDDDHDDDDYDDENDDPQTWTTEHIL